MEDQLPWTAPCQSGGLCNRPRKRSAASAFDNEESLVCVLCEKHASISGICKDCASSLLNMLGDEKVTKAYIQIPSLDLFVEEKVEHLVLCIDCNSFCLDSHFIKNTHRQLKLEKISDKWFVIIPKEEAWASAFEDVQILGCNDSTWCFPLACSSNAQCKFCCDRLHSADVYCKLQCKISDLQPREEWPSILLRQDFGKYCKMDMTCRSYPPLAFCSHCCLSHHSSTEGKHLKGSNKESREYTMTDCILKHARDENGHCYAECVRCHAKLTKKDSLSHGFLKNAELVLQQLPIVEEQQKYTRDGFCTDCECTFSKSLCERHRTHRTIQIMYYDGRYKFCGVVPTNTWDVTSTFFGNVQGLPHPGLGPELKIVPLGTCGSNKCCGCRRTIESGCRACCFRCKLRFLAQIPEEKGDKPKASLRDLFSSKMTNAKRSCSKKLAFKF